VPNGGLKEIEREIPDLRATLLGKRGFSVRHYIGDNDKDAKPAVSP
jgi:hypothetical protein